MSADFGTLNRRSLELTTFHYADQRREEEICQFIEEHQLTEYLKKAEQHIKKHFPHSAIQKELYTDHEEGGQTLYLTIISPSLSRKEVLKNNRRLFSNWDLAKLADFNTYVNITARALWVSTGKITLR